MDRNPASVRFMSFVTAILLMLGFGFMVVFAGTSTARLGNACSFSLSQQECSQLKSLPLTGYLTFNDLSYAAQDFGMLGSFPPAAVLHPGSERDIVSIVSAIHASGSNVTVAARGPGHSINGQSQALNGIVIEMSSISGIFVNSAEMFVEAGAGALWVDVLKATLQEGLTPKSFTDYLHLSVGGTLSNAGISGQAYRYGPQISNVLQLEIVTGTGAFVTCSRDMNSDLFFAVLGGLGQFGIITKARISLQPAKSNVRWIKAIYSDFALFKRDQELLISQANSSEAFDYVEGFVISNSANSQNGYNSVPFPRTGQAVNPGLMPSTASSPVLYYIELAKYYNYNESQPVVDEKINKLLSPLKFISTQIFSIDMSYFDFLERVYATELMLRSIGKWEVAHPWLDILVPASKIQEFDQTVFKSLNANDISGPLIVYPLNRYKWDTRMSAKIPDGDVFYLVAFLPSVVPSAGPLLGAFLSRNSELVRYCQSLGCKQYLPIYSTHADWQTHFGNSWTNFLGNKIKFDPEAILAPGQNIFARGQVPPLQSLPI
ncbi:unnamed protein product [Calypogeia fissa]